MNPYHPSKQVLIRYLDFKDAGKILIALDFDDTLHVQSGTYVRGKFGLPSEEAVKLAKFICEIPSVELWIFTVRCANILEAEMVVAWAKKYKIPFHGVTNVKLPFTAIIDNRAIQWKGSADKAFEKIKQLLPEGVEI